MGVSQVFAVIKSQNESHPSVMGLLGLMQSLWKIQ